MGNLELGKNSVPRSLDSAAAGDINGLKVAAKTIEFPIVL